MATQTEYKYEVLTDADKRPVVEAALRNVENQLFNAQVNDNEDTGPLRERAEELKKLLSDLTE